MWNLQTIFLVLWHNLKMLKNIQWDPTIQFFFSKNFICEKNKIKQTPETVLQTTVIKKYEISSLNCKATFIHW